MSSGDIVRDQFSALQKQQKDRLQQLQEKSTKKKTSTADVSDENNITTRKSLSSSSLGQCVNESGSRFRSISNRRGELV